MNRKYDDYDYMADTWDAMTDGMYGDMSDGFDGDMPDGFDGDFDFYGILNHINHIRYLNHILQINKHQSL